MAALITPPSRPAPAPSTSRTSTGKLTNSSGQASIGGRARAPSAPAANASAARRHPKASTTAWAAGEASVATLGGQSVSAARRGVRLGERAWRGGFAFGAAVTTLGGPLAPHRAIFAAVDADFLHAARIGIKDFDLEPARTRHQLAANRHPSHLDHQIAPQRIDFVGHFANVEIRPDGGGDLVEAGARIGEERAIGL